MASKPRELLVFTTPVLILETCGTRAQIQVFMLRQKAYELNHLLSQQRNCTHQLLLLTEKPKLHITYIKFWAKGKFWIPWHHQKFPFPIKIIQKHNKNYMCVDERKNQRFLQGSWKEKMVDRYYGLNKQCPPQSHIFDHLVPFRWYCLRREALLKG